MTVYSIVEDVEQITDELRDSEFVGLDTEFMREKTFFAELCLVQVATADGLYCVDPLGNSDMQSFWAAAMQTGWVVHSARQDIEVIYQAAQRMPLRLLVPHAWHKARAKRIAEVDDAIKPAQG